MAVASTGLTVRSLRWINVEYGKESLSVGGQSVTPFSNWKQRGEDTSKTMRGGVRAATAMISRAATRISRLAKPPGTSSSSSSSRLFDAAAVDRSRPRFDHRTLSRIRFQATSERPLYQSSFLPAMFLMGAFGAGAVQISYADASEEDYNLHAVEDSWSGSVGADKIVRQVRQRLEELLRTKGMQRGSYPTFTVSAKGNKEIEFIKQGSYSFKELEAVVSALKLAGERSNIKKSSGRNPNVFKRDDNYDAKQLASVEKSVSALEGMGVRVYGLDETSSFPWDGTVSWENIAGYDEQKREIEDTILLALQSPEIYDEIARGTRCKFETNRPRAVLFEGPPGCSLAIDGFEQEKQVVVIAATNRKQDLDPALISRFDSLILFSLPDQKTREEIAAQYAKHLLKTELVLLASATEGMSGRDIRDVCQQAERHWASKRIRGQAPKDAEGGGKLPPIEEYIQSAEQRREAVLATTIGGSNRSWKPFALA
ncbi:Holliday junction DNA helicase ruvB N-terminus [Musa troglodytarum]|uniref:Holliday junction DNA helicase ruvB N-terminus n=1 Tax=Musa troglodytarum TaxID=320322 RepID=A0A9E7GJF2_9LILI|nr:Holliday junction DNA helicase ruvB N-terminus [Musa troglodytarum]